MFSKLISISKDILFVNMFLAPGACCVTGETYFRNGESHLFCRRKNEKKQNRILKKKMYLKRLFTKQSSRSIQVIYFLSDVKHGVFQKLWMWLFSFKTRMVFSLSENIECLTKLKMSNRTTVSKMHFFSSFSFALKPGRRRWGADMLSCLSLQAVYRGCVPESGSRRIFSWCANHVACLGFLLTWRGPSHSRCCL